MFVDASALVAILANESDAASLAGRMEHAEKIYTSPVALYEATMGLARTRRISIAFAKSAIDRFLQEARVEIVSIDAPTGEAAIAAAVRFGRGRHRAALNMGDCFAYACAQRLGVPILSKGDDFPRTDITIA